jgi:PHD/YefM family antitoxin component YafN of YafNO toxin-antitoxin module
MGTGGIMLSAVKVTISQEEIIKAVKDMKKKERDAFLEDLLAATSPEYREGIREARADYKAGRVKTHKEVFGK